MGGLLSPGLIAVVLIGHSGEGSTGTVENLVRWRTFASTASHNDRRKRSICGFASRAEFRRMSRELAPNVLTNRKVAGAVPPSE